MLRRLYTLAAATLPHSSIAADSDDGTGGKSRGAGSGLERVRVRTGGWAGRVLPRLRCSGLFLCKVEDFERLIFRVRSK